jgi:hypothetical protein
LKNHCHVILPSFLPSFLLFSWLNSHTWA